MRKIQIFYSYRRLRIYPKVFLSLLCTLNFILITVNSVYAQSPNNVGVQRWIGFWADTSWLQNGVLDVIINSNGNMTGTIINGTHIGTWAGQINNNGVLTANYQYNEEQINYAARGVCLINNGQLIGRIEFIYQGRPLSKGNFALSPANAMGAASPPPSGNSDLSKSLETKPVGNQNLLKNGNPNVNDYGNNYKGYIDQLVPSYSDVVKDNLNFIHNYGNPATPSGSVPNTSNKSANPVMSDQPPALLLQAWIRPYNEYGVTTYDFTQLEAAGQRSVSIRGWQKIGTLGWQSNQNYTYNTFQYNAATNQVTITSATGYQEQWNIIKVENTKMLVESKGQQFYVYNCSDPGWPDAIKASMRGCR